MTHSQDMKSVFILKTATNEALKGRFFSVDWDPRGSFGILWDSLVTITDVA